MKSFAIPYSNMMSKIQKQQPRLLNLGCGARFHSDWVNVDFAASSDLVITHDLTQGIPFESNTFDVVYHSHVLEHLDRSNARAFLCECKRVLKTNGILRVVVPDLELIAEQYLRSIREINEDGGKLWHTWSVIQLIDQCTREKSGGEMIKFLDDVELRYSSLFSATSSTAKAVLAERAKANSEGKPIQIRGPQNYFRALVSRIKEQWVNWKTREGTIHEDARIGRFRLSGEVHKWMYDRISLSSLLDELGFEDIQVTDPLSSKIPDWVVYCLDTNSDKSVYKPDSLYVESRAPSDRLA